MNYYNEIDPFAVAWLRELIADGLIPKGEVDDRSIADVAPPDLDGFVQCHFFAGIGGWPYALRLAGWPDDLPVWTGSCPCQPFSVAGKGGGLSDERHLWPAFRWLIAKRRPAIVFGEQVASADGREWLSGIRSDLEVMGYAVGAADLCAAGVEAPHIRQRLFWVGHANQQGPQEHGAPRQGQRGAAGRAGAVGRVADAANDHGRGRERRAQAGVGQDGIGRRGSPSGGFWDHSVIIPCADGKWRRVPGGASEREIEPALFPLADGIPNRVGTLRGAGNAIVPQVAAEFIRAAVS